jgi:hypothetical protein
MGPPEGTCLMRARTVAAETLDNLAADDPAALRSRRDLRRVHRAMGTEAMLVDALRDMQATEHAPLRVLELGAGDGSLMLGVARALAPEWPRVHLTLLDRHDLVERATIEGYAALGWTAVPAVADVFAWAVAPTDWRLLGDPASHWDVIVANLFMHHFEALQIVTLLGAIAARTDHFFACEPRRHWLALAGSHLVGALGANAVTREDAVLSVHAGFRAEELSALWPVRRAQWHLHEYSAGLFSHCFRAEQVVSY